MESMRSAANTFMAQALVNAKDTQMALLDIAMEFIAACDVIGVDPELILDNAMDYVDDEDASELEDLLDLVPGFDEPPTEEELNEIWELNEGDPDEEVEGD